MMVPPSKSARISMYDLPQSEQDDNNIKRISCLSVSSRKKKDGSCTPERVPLSPFTQDATLWPNDNVSGETSFGRTLLHIAATEGNKETIKTLLSNPMTDVNAVDGDGWTSLHMAVKGGHFEAAQMLIADHRTNVNAGGGYVGCTPLHLAAMGGHHEVLNMLLLHSRINVNAVDKIGSTAFHIVTKESCKHHGFDKRYVRCIKSLMETTDLKVNKPDMYGHTALSHAMKNGCKTTVRTILLCHGKHFLNLETSAADEMKTVRERILSLYPEFKSILPPPLLEDLNSPNPQTRLLAAVQHDCLDTFRQVLKKAQVNIDYWYDEPYYSTCLEMSCTLEGRQEFARNLIEAGANVNTVNPVSDVPLLHMVAKRGNLELLNVLLSTDRIDINIKDCCQRTVLHCLARLRVSLQEEGQLLRQSLVLILESDFSVCRMIDLDATDEWGNTALHVAARFGNTEMVDILLRNGADINVMDGCGETALHIAARDGNQDTVVMLMKHGADLMFNKFRQPPLSHIDRSTLRRFFDECLETNDKTPHHQDFRLTFNYSFLAPKTYNRCKREMAEMPLLLYMSQDRRLRHMLKHPVITSFLYLKWNYARSFFYINLLFYFIFLCFLTTHVLLTDYSSEKNILEFRNKTSTLDPTEGKETVIPGKEIMSFENITMKPCKNLEENSTTSNLTFSAEDSKNSTFAEVPYNEVMNCLHSQSENATHHNGLPQPETNETATLSRNTEETNLELGIRMGLTVMVVMFAMRELTQFVSVTKQYLRRTSTFLRLSIIILAAILCMRQFDNRTEHHCASVAVLLAWFELLLRIGCIPDCSVLMQMLQTVSLTFVKFMSFYSPLIIAFSLCAFTMFHGSGSKLFYQNIWVSVMKSVLMMTGEYEASAMEFDMLPVTSHVILVIFILLISVILLNLLSGLAVSDTQAIKNDAETLSLIARVRLIYNIENLVCGAAHSKWIFPRFIRLATPNLCSVFKSYPDKQVHVFPNRTKGNICLDENEPRMNTAMSRDIINIALKQISKRKGSLSRESDGVQGTILRGWGSENSSQVSRRVKDLCEQQEMLTNQVGAQNEMYECKLVKVEQEINAMASVVKEVGVKYDVLSENQEKVWNELLEARAEIREVLCQSRSGAQEDILKQSELILQLERKFCLLEETINHTKDTVDQIFSFVILQQRST